MEFRHGKRLGVPFALMLVLGLFAGVALAHVVKETAGVSASTTTSGNTNAIGGQITVASTDCARNRRFQVVRKKPGPDKVVGEEKTDPLGAALVAFPDGLREDSYYVRVTQRRLQPKNANHRHICLGDRTRSDEFGLDPSFP
jgi:hypothetical protein